MVERAGRIKGFEWLPLVAVALFGSRLLNEWLAVQFGPFVGRVLVVTLLVGGVSYGLMRKRPFSQTYPFLLLFLYVFAPALNFGWATAVLLLTLLMWGQVVWASRENGQGREGFERFFALLRMTRGWRQFALLAGIFVLYVATMMPDVLPADNGEFQRVAAQLDVAHPPGFALYTILAHVMTWLPLPVTAAYKVSLFATLCSMGALFFVYTAVYHLTQRHLASVVATVGLASATTFWAQATTANIRSLTAFFAAATIYCLIRYGEAADDERERWLLAAALVVAFGITHHASLIFMGVVFGVYVLWVTAGLWRSPQRWIRPLLLGTTSLLPLLYFPWRALAGARGSAGLDSWDGFWFHVLASGFRGDFFYFVEPVALADRLRVMGNVMRFQFSPWLLLGMGIGLLYLLRQRPRLAFLLGGSWGVHTVITATYRAPQTVEYMLPAYVAVAICLGYGVGQLEWRRESWLRPFMTALFLTAALVQTWQLWPSYRWLRAQNDTRVVSEQLLADAPANSTILAHWHWANPLWYLQEVEGQRPDVQIRFVFPEGEPYAQTWARRTAAELAEGKAVVTTHFDAAAYQNLPAPRAIGEAFLFEPNLIDGLPSTFTPLTEQLGEAVTVLGYEVSDSIVSIGQEVVLTVEWQGKEGEFANSSLFAHLVGANGLIYAQADIPVTVASEGIQFTQFRLTPRLGALPGGYQLLVGGYANDGSGVQAYLDSQGAPRSQVAVMAVVAMAERPFTQNPTFYKLLDDERSLAGYDWDHTLAEPPRLYLHWQTEVGFVTEVRQPADGLYLVPPRVGVWGFGWPGTVLVADGASNYVPFGQGIVWTGPLLVDGASLTAGDTILAAQSFEASYPVVRDVATSVRLVGYEDDSFLWAWNDLDEEFGVPAMGGVPTLKWVAGSTVYDPHRLQVSETAVAGQEVGVLLGLYDTFTNQPVPVLDERFTPATPWRRGVVGE